MIILKSTILIFIFLGSTSIGWIISKRYSKRVEELKEIQTDLNILENKIKFSREALNEIFIQIGQSSKNKIGEIFKTASINLKLNTTKEAWQKSIEENAKNLSLEKEDIKIIEDLGNTLGKTDVEGQISQIELTKKFIEVQISKAEEERKKNEKMYKSLGSLIGLAIVIILI